MNFRLICLGKDKDAWLSAAIDEYIKRLRPFCKLEIIQLSDVSIKTTGSAEVVIQKEARLIEARLEADDFVILLNENGEEKSSLEFSQFLSSISCNKRIVFVIGGVYGTSEQLKTRADKCLSLSRLTFTHRMARLILIEQIYRAMMILGGRSYHI
ncbi:MAG: 23S rRNA (pseudouridine(1915)-N(3))-methyltransferase RlmH [Candidatus Cloacimonetes bacterium]|jgi:23S rRNA (pseudouridine1915-N3)-methyltransferase|nr:23S rRNA (pseudouridine(1915)-N(3))-methyltransferase RlmH [Candidatus Cloacimonadota bacterium]MDY0336890.1 23S rRNA (pseudouridine(1915)-N(3))-methyltransferase RlmH [Candidatus Cloacimonadaceae bacterium]MCB5269045.1 23S rRNA (pseudouridine(1915)-N(3))-methyltransferase RlmH [Candidatus Cloacimonadota bacterium]MCK9334843.1 23S rRNA (pseudouridine(1915)-N(3))-methyltransferase RlmH [Candidatus Cloacimonadota bacterium]MDD2543423.1 23S rRNA (pseudouridine(1915)-N(3))-methyltransferase RlmH